MSTYIYQKRDWPHFLWNDERLITLLADVRNLQGRIIGRMESMGFELRNEATLEALTQEIITSTEIEGEILNPEQVRSSVARRLGINTAGLIPSDRHVDGVVDLMMDAVQNYKQDLSVDRLFDWPFFFVSHW